jgi:hypothetical protein
MQLDPGMRIRVVQEIHRREGVWRTHVEGTVLSHEACRTGSWFAHSPKGKLWLNRVTVRKDDGEQVTLSLDEHSQVTILSRPAEGATR